MRAALAAGVDLSPNQATATSGTKANESRNVMKVTPITTGIVRISLFTMKLSVPVPKSPARETSRFDIYSYNSVTRLVLN